MERSNFLIAFNIYKFIASYKKKIYIYSKFIYIIFFFLHVHYATWIEDIHSLNTYFPKCHQNIIYSKTRVHTLILNEYNGINTNTKKK